MGRAKEPEFVPPTAAVTRELQSALLDWYSRARRDLPWRRTSDPWPILVSELMLQQTRVETVLAHWSRFLERFPTPDALAKVSEADVLEAWSGLGYYRRARSLQAAARALVERHDGEFPRDLEAALDLPGVGPYTAGAVLSIAYDTPAPIVDGNVERVFARLFGLDGARGSSGLSRSAWAAARHFIDALVESRGSARDWNQALMELGALVCTPRKPRCGECALAARCMANARGTAEATPAPKPVREPVEVELEVYVVTNGAGEWLMQRRPEGGRMANLWEFPTVETTRSGLYPDDLAAPLRPALEPQDDRFRISHSITHHRIRARVRDAISGSDDPTLRDESLKWVPMRDAADGALTGMARKIVRRLSAEGAPSTE